jgi:hypothetical protein
VFNANEPIDHAQIAAVKTALVNKKMALETRLRSAVARLQQVASFAVDQRNSLIASANAAFVKLNQARSDESATYPVFMRVAKFVSVSCLGIVFLNLASPLLANLPQVQPYAHAPRCTTSRGAETARWAAAINERRALSGSVSADCPAFSRAVTE